MLQKSLHMYVHIAISLTDTNTAKMTYVRHKSLEAIDPVCFLSFRSGGIILLCAAQIKLDYYTCATTA